MKKRILEKKIPNIIKLKCSYIIGLSPYIIFFTLLLIYRITPNFDVGFPLVVLSNLIIPLTSLFCIIAGYSNCIQNIKTKSLLGIVLSILIFLIGVGGFIFSYKSGGVQ